MLDRSGSAGSFPLLTEGKVASPVPSGRIDTLGFSFDVESNFQVRGGSVAIDGFGTAEERFRVRHGLPGGGFLNLGIGGKAWVEASLPKRIDGRNVEAVGVPEALEIARDVYEEAGLFCTPRADGKRFELSRLVRLDPVRDFDGVAHVTELLNGLAAVPRDSRYKVRRFADPERNRAESMRVGPNAWASQLYDKHVESKGDAAAGRLRYEGRFHREQLESAFAKANGCVMGRIVDVREDKVQRLTRASFERVGFDREVLGKASVAEAVFGCDWLSRRQQAELWTYLTAPGAAARMGRNAASRYRRTAQELGVTMAAAEEEAADVFVRLDFDKGTEVFRADVA